MEDSILKSTKKLLGLSPDYTAFDLDVITHINTVFSALTQMGVGPYGGFMIEDDTSTWSEFMVDGLLVEDVGLNSVRSYMAMKVRLLFDPPATSFAIKAIEDQLREMEWRLNVHREGVAWTPPATSSPVLENYEM